MKLIIRNSQLSVLSQNKLRIFIDKMVEFVFENFKITDKVEDIRKELFSIVEEAETYGFEEEETIEQYIFLKWEYPEFKKNPLSAEIYEILTYPGREPVIKIEELILLFEGKKELEY